MRRYRENKYKKPRKYSSKNQKRHYGLGKKKSIFSSHFFWRMILIFIVLLFIVYFFIFSSFFKIKNIKIHGNLRTSGNEINDIINEQINKKIIFMVPKNLFGINFEETNQIILDRFPHIKEINLERKFFTSLIVNIEERIPVGIWCQTYYKSDFYDIKDEGEKIEIEINKCFKVDEQGIVFEKSEEQGKLIIKLKTEKEIVLGQNVIEEDYLEKILEIKKEIEDNLDFKIKEFFIEQREKLIVKVKDNWEIYFNLENDVSNQLLNLKLVLKEKISPEEEKNIEYIDLRFNNKVFYR